MALALLSCAACSKKAPATAPAPPGSGELELTALFELVAPSVGRVISRDGPGGSELARATAFLVVGRSTLVTASHALAPEASYEVQFSGGRVIGATVVGRDAETDVALLELAEPADADPLPLADTRPAAVGTKVCVIGNPSELLNTLRCGIVSGRGPMMVPGASGRRLYLQTDAWLQSGDSGGPLVDLRGRVVGMAAMVATLRPGLGFVVPATTLSLVLPHLRDEGHVRRSWLGARVVAAAKGALVRSVDEQGPAQAAGLLPGDEIIEFGGRSVLDAVDLRDHVALAGAGKPAQVLVRRAGDLVRLEVVPRAYPLGE